MHGAGDALPGLFVDVAADWAIVHLRDAWHDRADEVLDEVAALGFRGVYLKRHPRRASGRGSRWPDEWTPTRASRGEDAPTPLWVREAGLPFALELGRGLSVGLFFDQRDNRARVRAAASGRDVLNLFAYTCGFGVAAAVGGAARTTNVDVARRALEVGRGNYEAAGLSPDGHRFFREDALRFLDRAARRGDSYGMVCVDPPTFGRAGSRRFASGRDWVGLAGACAAILAPDGVLLASSNDERLDVAAFEGLVVEGLGAAARRFDLRPLAPPPDHPTAQGGPPQLKALWATAREDARPPGRRRGR